MHHDTRPGLVFSAGPNLLPRHLGVIRVLEQGLHCLLDPGDMSAINLGWVGSWQQVTIRFERVVDRAEVLELLAKLDVVATAIISKNCPSCSRSAAESRGSRSNRSRSAAPFTGRNRSRTSRNGKGLTTACPSSQTPSLSFKAHEVNVHGERKRGQRHLVKKARRNR